MVHLIFANDVYQSLRLFNPTPENIEIVAKVGIPLDHLSGKKGVYIDLTASEDQTIDLISLGMDIEIIIPDLTEHYLSRNISSDSRDFPMGSMQGNYTFDELNARFDELQAEYSNIISERVILGQSVEGRDIWAFKVSDNPEEDEEEPEVLFTALTHAREPVGMMNLIYFVQLLGEEYGSDPELTYLVNEREIWFLPVVNPDGYVYNESIQPNGGGMHRKNRRDTNCGEGTNRGVDLNRNYSFGWGANNTGSSQDPCATTYRGESAFSEPETQIVSDFILDHEFMNVLHYHTYSNVYIHAFGDLAENRVHAIKVGSRGERNKELAAVRARSGVRHRQNSSGIVAQIRIELVAEAIPRPAGTGTLGVATLHHESGDYPVERKPIIVAVS